MLLRILTVAAILGALACLAPHASAAPMEQRHGQVTINVTPAHGVPFGFRAPVGWRHPVGFGFRGFGPGFGLAPFLPVAVAAPLVVPVAVPSYAPAFAPPQVTYPALPVAAPCGCPQ